MKFSCKNIPLKSTNSFADLVMAYVSKNEVLQPFYNYEPSFNSIEKAIDNKKNNYTQRQNLVDYFSKNYKNQNASEQQLLNIEKLKNDNCFTITTAHQPNIFTGPLYFIYKIFHAIKMAEELNRKYDKYSFVPVYYMGSEDADLDEIGNTTIQQKKLIWQTNQTGAVGRMKVDKSFINLIEEMAGQIGVLEFGNNLIDIFKLCYTLNEPIQNCTFKLVNELFKEYGLLVLMPDDKGLKKAFEPVIFNELLEQFSEKEVTKTVSQIEQHFKIKQTGRDLNLFYLIDEHRERIEIKNDTFIIGKLGLSFTKESIVEELKNYPERFSYNVILRPVFQEFILPNIAFVGGGGELSYWLQLKSVFEKVNVHFPILFLRNSFLVYGKDESNKLEKMNLKIENLFENFEQLFTNWVASKSTNELSLEDDFALHKKLYHQLKEKANTIDKSLNNHVEALETKAFNKLEALQKKMLRAEKRKFETEKIQLKKIKSNLFPNNSLQERSEGFIYFHSKYGKKFMQMIYECSGSFEQEFTLIEVE